MGGKCGKVGGVCFGFIVEGGEAEMGREKEERGGTCTLPKE